MNNLADILNKIEACDMEQPFVFVSYNQADYELVWRDVLELQRLGFNVWLDEKNVDKKKKTWQADALGAIADTYCELVIFYVSRNSLASEACLKELEKTMDRDTIAYHCGIVKFIAIEAEPVGDIIAFQKKVHTEIRSSKLKKEDKHKKMETLDSFIYDIFGGNNEKVRILSWDDEYRKRDYYDEITGELPITAKIYPEYQKEKPDFFEVNELYRDCMELITLELPHGIKEVSDDAFRGREDLLKVTIPSSVTRIGVDAFSECINLESVEILGKVTEIDTGAFRGCKKLKKILLSRELKRIGDFVFSDCRNLKIMEMPDNVSAMGYGVFQGCEKLKHISVPKAVKEVKSYTFAGCKNLEFVMLPDQIAYIGTQAFAECKRLNTIWLPKCLEKIDYAAFQLCEQLKCIVIPEKVKSIAPFAFADCSNLTKVTLGQKTEFIGGNAFGGCENLREIYFPGSVKEVVSEAFSECDSLEYVSVPKGAKIGENAFPTETKIKYYAGA